MNFYGQYFRNGIIYSNELYLFGKKLVTTQVSMLTSCTMHHTHSTFID